MYIQYVYSNIVLIPLKYDYYKHWILLTVEILSIYRCQSTKLILTTKTEFVDISQTT